MNDLSVVELAQSCVSCLWSYMMSTQLFLICLLKNWFQHYMSPTSVLAVLF